MTADPFLRRVRIQNYKSIGHCNISLGTLTTLIGRNGSGKSNFLDALSFISDGLDTSLDHAIRSRGGIDAVRRRSSGHPRNFRISVEMNLPNSQDGTYTFEIGSKAKGGFFVKHESLTVRKANGLDAGKFTVEDGSLASSSVQAMPPAVSDRLYLVSASGLPEFRPVYDALTGMGFYSLNPEEMRRPQTPDAGDLLHRDGKNIASVISRLTEDRPELKARIAEYLRAIVPGIVDFSRVAMGNHETLEFRQNMQGAQYPWRFYAANMSDGTLRALGILVAVMQLAHRISPVRVVGIEEPEIALHPAAAGALMDSLREAAAHTQILLTTLSPDLLDQLDLETDTLLVVQADQGTTEIGPANQTSLNAIRDHLYTPGELLRMDQFEPDKTDLESQIELAF